MKLVNIPNAFHFTESRTVIFSFVRGGSIFSLAITTGRKLVPHTPASFSFGSKLVAVRVIIGFSSATLMHPPVVRRDTVNLERESGTPVVKRDTMNLEPLTPGTGVEGSCPFRVWD